MSQQQAVAAAPPAAGEDRDRPARLQRLVDQAAGFNAFVVPDARRPPEALRARGGVLGAWASGLLHRFEIDLADLSTGDGVRVANTWGEVVGRLDLRWMVVPHDWFARPDREPPATELDPGRSQRFSLQEATFSFGDGRDGFRSFGTGRTFPYLVGGRPRLLAAAVANVTEGFGRFAGHEGNYTLCGEITPDHGFLAHALVRIQDHDGQLRTAEDLPPLQAVPDPDPAATYLLWGAQKGTGPDQQNRPSFAPDGTLRGLIIPTELKDLRLDFAVGSGGFCARDFRIGGVIGSERGFGRGSDPKAGPEGSALRPFLFDGVTLYSFHDSSGKAVGSITTNVLEGRRFDMRLPGAPGESALRFGFFGPIVTGSGCFRGVEGLFYGSSGSVFNPPPGVHVITHFYMARLNDPDGRFRAGRSRS